LIGCELQVQPLEIAVVMPCPASECSVKTIHLGIP
jgi:hypothetical protein